MGESYLLAGERASYGEVLGLVAEEAGKRRPILLPNGLVARRRVDGADGAVSADPAGDDGRRGRAGMATYYGDSTKARRELGWSSRPLRSGITETVRVELAAR